MMKKLYTLQSRSGWLLLCLLLALNSNARPYRDTTNITLHVVNQPIESIFKLIEKQTGFVIFYGNSIINKKTRASISVDNASLSEVMNTLLKAHKVAWKINNNGIVLSKADNQVASSVLDTIPKVTVRGTISSDEGFLLPGATVQTKGGKGTITNSTGQFTLSGIPIGTEIKISYTGYISQEIIATTTETFIIRLQRAAGTLDEQVVIAYGTSSRRLLTGSIGRITAKEIADQPVSNPLATLQGRISGLMITQNTGLAGGNFKVQIRGQNSVRNSEGNNLDGTNANNPLYIIDGVPYISNTIITGVTSGPTTNPYPTTYSGSNPLNSINPADIESIEVLKDADATAIYGSRGANGVILITTKRGTSGQTRVSGEVYSGYGQITRRLNLLSTQQYLDMRTEAFKNDGFPTPPAYAVDANGKWGDRYTDWQEELLGGTARSSDAQVSVYGGSINTQYRFGGGYHKETSVFPGNFSEQRGSAHINITSSSINNKFKANFTATYSAVKTTLPIRDLTQDAIMRPPNAPFLYKDDGTLNYEDVAYFPNPLQYTAQPFRANTANLIAQSGLNYEILPGLTIRTSLGFTSINRKEITKVPVSSLPPGTAGVNTSYIGNADVKSWIIEPQISYQKYLGKSAINLLVGSTFQDETQEGLSHQASGFTNEALMEDISAVPSANVTNSSSYYKYRYNAIFGRISYNYDKKYLINLTGRRDGSSRFGANRQFGNFGSMGLGWVFTGEKFMESISNIVNFGKLRASYGISGNDQIPNYAYLDSYRSSGQYIGAVGLGPTKLINPDFSWEKVKKFETGLELSFFQNALSVTTVYFQNRSSNQLVTLPLPPTAGLSDITANLDATVENKGWEFDLNSTNIKRNGFRWQSSINLSIPKNELLKYDNIENSIYANTYLVGQPLSISRLYHFDGVDPQTGFYKVKDVDENGRYNISDRTYIGVRSPRYFGGLSNSFQYKGIQLDFLFQYVKQEGRNYLLPFGILPPGSMSNRPDDVLERWQKPGDDKPIQKFTTLYYTEYGRIMQSNLSVTDASFIRLKNVALSYTFPFAIMDKLGIQHFRIYMHAQNLLTFTKYKGLDPESQGATLPPLRMITGGLQIVL